MGEMKMKPKYEELYLKYMKERLTLDEEAYQEKAANYRMDLLQEYPEISHDQEYWDKMGDLYDGNYGEEILFVVTANYIQNKRSGK